MSLNGNATATERLQGRIKNIDVIYKDAYRIAVENGFEGTITEWLASLKGEKGDPAPKTPNPDWNQENPDSADYILNKPDIGGMIADQIDDANQYTDKTWSSSRIYGTIIENRSFANNYTDNKVAGIIDDTVVAKYKTWSSGKIAPMIVDCYEYAAEQANGIIDDAAVSDKAWSSKNTVDKLCPSFSESGGVAVCEPVEGYPLEVISIFTNNNGELFENITLNQSNNSDFSDGVSLTTDFFGSPDGGVSNGYYNWTTGLLCTDNNFYQHYPDTDEYVELNDEAEANTVVRNIYALPGMNYFRSDCGDTTVSGKVDPNKYWAEKLAEQEAELAKLNKQYELIEEVTLEEDAASFTRTADPYGVPYDFSAVKVQIKAEIADKSQSLLAALGCATSSSYVYHQISNGLSTEVRHAHLMCRNDHGQLDYYAMSTNTNSPGNMMARANYLGKAWQNITRINLTAATSVIPAGTTIKIYGIRG